MAAFRLSFFFEYGKAGWTEQWYRSEDTLPQAAAIQAPTLNNYMQLRADGVTLRAIRVNSVLTPRLSQLRIINLQKNTAAPGDWGQGEPAQVAMLGYVLGANFSRRPLLLKGLDDDLVGMNSNGTPSFTGAFRTKLQAFISALNGMGAQIKTLKGVEGTNTDRFITELTPGNASTTTTSFTFTGNPVNVGDRLVFHKLPRQQYPGFGGTVPVIAVGAGAATVPVAWSGPTAARSGNGATFRVSDWAYNNVTDVIAEDFRSRKVGRPSLLSRGRRQGIRYRSA